MLTQQQPNTQENTKKEETSNSHYFRKTIEGTPFTIVHNNENEYITTVGNYYIEKYSSLQQAEYDIENKSWHLIGALASIIATTIKKEEQEKEHN